MNDTPASILFDKSLSNGFSEGDKDKETEISIIESFRENKLTPLYNLTDYYVMLKAWDSAFIDDIRYKYSEYQDKTDGEIFRSWAENFKFQYGNLFPEPESVTQDNNAKKLDNLLKAQQLGANQADLQEELNESEIFKNEMELDSQPQGMDGMGGTDAADDEEVFDYTQNEAVQNDSTIKADDDKIPPNTEWKTLDNGARVLVDKNTGEVVYGAGGALEENKEDKKESKEDNKQEDKEENNNEDSSEEKQKEEKEIKEKIEQLEKIDWTKDNTLPNFSKSFLKKQGLEDKPILLKKNIIEKNKASHPDISEEEAKRIIGNALYKPEVILKANRDKPAYHNFISRTDDKHSDLVLLELSDKKENYEIVNYHVIRDKDRNRKEELHQKIINKKS